MPKLQKLRKALAARVAAPLIAALAKTGVTPNMVTVAGFLVVIAAAVLVYLGYPLAAGLVMLFSGCFDFVDGALARATNVSANSAAFWIPAWTAFRKGLCCWAS
jgi:CDP-diacylglycerol--glycerol-3-phosphate 3-phosphatidyltransferase